MGSENINVGGQAVIEGVLIRGPKKYVVAVRKNGRIISKSGNVPIKQNKLVKLPFIRGFVNLVDMMHIGIKTLMWSAQQAGGEKEKIGRKEITFTLFLSLVFGIAFFMALPYLLTSLTGLVEEKRPLFFNFIDGLFRVAIFLLYIYAISFMKDIRVLFQYHGAEHMAIHCYEHGRKLDAKTVRKFTTLHPRCGTSFILLVLLVSIIVFSILPALVMNYYPDFIKLNHWLRKGILFPARILLLPLIAGISYEILKISDKRQNNALFKMISLPGLLLQKITTQKPTNRQIEVAIHSLNKLLKIEKKAR